LRLNNCEGVQKEGQHLIALEAPVFLALHLTTPRHLPIIRRCSGSVGRSTQVQKCGGFWLPLIQHRQPRDAPTLGMVVRRCHVHVYGDHGHGISLPWISGGLSLAGVGHTLEGIVAATTASEWRDTEQREVSQACCASSSCVRRTMYLVAKCNDLFGRSRVCWCD
jgi:hypothetical protein